MILLTGFGPFGGLKRNPTTDLVRLLSESTGYPHVILDVIYGKASEELLEAYHKHGPDVILSFGLALGRAKITPERFALNRQGPRRDVSGNKVYGKIDPDGPAALMTKFDVNVIVEELNSAGIPAAESFYAGTYLCNYIYYHALKLTGGNALFVHIPADYRLVIEENKDVPSMSMETLLKAAKIIVKKLEHRCVFVSFL